MSAKSEHNAAGAIFLGLMFCLPFCGFLLTRIICNINFDVNCGGHLKRAADANTIELASQELGQVLNYLEQNNMTKGYTSLLYRTPDEDIGFWYTNLKASMDELNKVTPQTTQLERTNLLIKLRETLLDHGDKGQKVTEPDGITVYPNNVAMAFFGWGSVFCLLPASIGFFVGAVLLSGK
jgi:hypothetical protein